MLIYGRETCILTHGWRGGGREAKAVRQRTHDDAHSLGQETDRSQMRLSIITEPNRTQHLTFFSVPGCQSVWEAIVEDLAGHATRDDPRLLALVRFGCTSPSPSLPVSEIVLTRQSPLVVVPRLAGTGAAWCRRLGGGDGGVGGGDNATTEVTVVCAPARAGERENGGGGSLGGVG